MHGDRNAETYITMRETGQPVGTCCATHRAETGALCQPRGEGWGGRRDGEGGGREAQEGRDTGIIRTADSC